MKLASRTLSVFVALMMVLSAIATPVSAAKAAPAYFASTPVEAAKIASDSLHPFTSSEALILDAIEELRAMNRTYVEMEPDQALVDSVEEATEMTYDEVKNSIAASLKDGMSKGMFSVANFGLSKEDVAAILNEVMAENFLYNAITDLRISTNRDGESANVRFEVSEGYVAAMEAMNEEFGYELSVDATAIAAEIAAAEEAKPAAAGSSSEVPEEGEGTEGEGTEGEGTEGEGTEGEEHDCTAHTVSAIKLGDLNEDDTHNILDVIALRNKIQDEQVSLKHGDFNNDGNLNILDAIALRNAIQDDTLPSTSGTVNFEWQLDYNFDPVFRTNENGEWVDADGNVTQDPAAAIMNGGLVYNPQTGEILEGTLANVYYKLVGISFECSVCGQDIALADDPATEDTDEMAQFSMTKDIWVNTATGTTQALDVGAQPTIEEGYTEDDYILYTDMQIGTYMDDTFSLMTDANGVPVQDANGNYIPKYVMDEQGNPILDEAGNVQIIGMFTSDPMDNGAAEVGYYYSILSAFNQDYAEYFGISTDYWTAKNTEANPMAALKVLCNLDPNMDIPPAQMIQMVQMLPQAFMAYVYYYGAELLAMRDAAMAEVQKLPSGSGDIAKMLVIHDWLAENAVFDMGSMLNVTDDGGGNDPIQMTTFGALLSNQLSTVQNSPYYGGICLAYAAAYTYLIQAAYPEIYTTTVDVDADGDGTAETTETRWATPAEVDAKGGDIVDFSQVMFYADTAETSIAGEGFGGGLFNNVHYFNAVRLDDAPTSTVEDDAMIGNWFYVDSCYNDIYVECLAQYRVEAEGSVYHSYFLVSPQTMAQMWASNIDYIDSLYDGYVYQVEYDANGNMVPSDNVDEDSYDYDPTHPNYVKVEVTDGSESFNDNTCYENSWFSGAVSKIYHDGTNWYYVDTGSSASTYSSMLDDNGDINIDFDQMLENGLNMDEMTHSNRVGKDTQNKMKLRSMNDPDYWVEEDDGEESFMDTGKEDPYAKVLFDYGTGVATDTATGTSYDASEALLAAVEEDFIYNDQYPSLTHALAMVNGNLYFNLGNQIWSMTKTGGAPELFREYNTVNAASDGRIFKGSSYTVAGEGDTVALTVYNNPIAALASHTTYIPLYNYIDAEGNVVLDFQGNPSELYMGKLQSGEMTQEQMQAAIVGRQFVMMYGTDSVTVNIGTNYSYTSAFEEGMDDDAKRASVYTKEAVNYNADYTQGFSSDDSNSNETFLWCANIRESMAASEWAAATIGEDTVTCAAHNDGHSYVYNEAEQAYICSACNIHAVNISAADVEGAEDMHAEIVLTAEVSSGMSEEFLENNNQGEDTSDVSTTTEPVSPEREGAISQDDVIVTVIPEEGYGLPVAEYTIEGSEEAVLLPLEQNENGEYTATITKEAKSCLTVTVSVAETVDVTVEEAENGEVSVVTTVEVQAETEGEAEETAYWTIAEGETAPAPKNDVITIVAEPEEGYAVKSVTVAAASGTTVVNEVEGEYKFTLNGEDITVTVEFEKVYQITVDEAIENGAVTTDVAEGVAGTVVTVAVAEDEGFRFVEDSLKVSYTVEVPAAEEGGEATTETKFVEVTAVEGTDDYQFTMPAADVVITAEFSEIFTVEVGNTITGGTVTADKTDAIEGETVTLTVTPGEGNAISAVTYQEKDNTSATPVAVTAVEGVYSFQMPAYDVVINATFETATAVTYTVTVDTPENGTVTADKTVAAEGEEVTLTITAADGYEVDTVKVMNGETEVTVADGKFTMPAGNVTVTVTFKEVAEAPATYTVTVTDPENGTVTADKTVAAEGEEVTLTITAADGYEVDTVKVMNGETEVAVADGKFTMPAGNVTVTVTFKAVVVTPTEQEITITETTNRTISNDEIAAGTTVKLNITKPDGMANTYVVVTDAEGANVEVSDDNTFVMPEGGVTIDVSFGAANETPIG